MKRVMVPLAALLVAACGPTAGSGEVSSPSTSLSQSARPGQARLPGPPPSRPQGETATLYPRGSGHGPCSIGIRFEILNTAASGTTYSQMIEVMDTVASACRIQLAPNPRTYGVVSVKLDAEGRRTFETHLVTATGGHKTFTLKETRREHRGPPFPNVPATWQAVEDGVTYISRGTFFPSAAR